MKSVARRGDGELCGATGKVQVLRRGLEQIRLPRGGPPNIGREKVAGQEQGRERRHERQSFRKIVRPRTLGP